MKFLCQQTSSYSLLFIAIYANNLLLFGLDITCLEGMQQKLQDQFKMTDLEDISHCFEMQVNHVLATNSLSAQVLIARKYLTASR